jgi:cyclopropane fatty-acyl-phospholipid synthase-like methyltransferase
VNTEGLLAEVRQYYEASLAAHGATPRGVDWKSAESQALRFRQLGRLFADDPDGTILDFGCGYGALAAYLRQSGHAGAYVGFDLSERMVAEATRTFALRDCRYTTELASLEPSDYVVASGVFNVKLRTPAAEWRLYLQETLRTMRSLARRGLAFNALTSYSDADRQRPDLYYADPLDLFDYCKRHISPSVALLHDYPLHEFTILARL